MKIKNSDDYAEFEKQLQSGETAAPVRDDNSASPSDLDRFMGDDAPPGEIVQYAANGPGFTFTSHTVKRIPSGSYDIGMVNDQLTLIPHRLQTDTLIRLPDTRGDQLIAEIDRFWALKREFKEGNEKAHGGFMHKRGYLLFGPPGSGKTSTVAFVKKAVIDAGGIVLMANQVADWLAQALKNIRKIEPDRNILVVLEDFDALISNRNEETFLSILDGENSIDGALFLATTNYASKFDARMYNRPGRLSDVVYVGMPSREAREMYLNAKLKDKSDIQRILDLSDGFSLDHLRALILGVYFEKKDLEKEAARLHKLFKPPKDNPGKTMGIGAGD